MAGPRSKTAKDKTAKGKAVKPRRRTSPASQDTNAPGLLKIGEAARQLGVEAYVLRFWESQFPFLRPRSSVSSHRLYQPKDLEVFRMVKRLLHVEGFTIAGAKRHIRQHGIAQLCANGEQGGREEPEAAAPIDAAPQTGASDWGQRRELLIQIRDELAALCDALKRE